jgi:3-oxoacid CoA-transferase
MFVKVAGLTALYRDTDHFQDPTPGRFLFSHLTFREGPANMLLSHKALYRANLTSLRLAVLVSTPGKVRTYGTPSNTSPRNKSKVWSSADHAVQDIKSGSVLLCGGEQTRTSHDDSLNIFEIRLWLGWYSRLMLLPTNYGEQSVWYPMSDTLLGALAKREDVKDLVGVSNNSGGGDSGLGEYWNMPL